MRIRLVYCFSYQIIHRSQIFIDKKMRTPYSSKYSFTFIFNQFNVFFIYQFLSKICYFFRAAAVREWQDAHPNIFFLPWPPKGADLNPIENLWAAMVRDWEPGERPTKEGLLNHAHHIWNNLRRRDEGTPNRPPPPTLCEKLIESMPRRLQACIDADGDFTKYCKLFTLPNTRKLV